MHRRAFLSVTTAAALTAGCLSAGSSGSGNEIEAQAEDSQLDAPSTSFQARWNARLQPSIGPTANDSRLHARDGRAFLVVRMAVENDGEEPFETTVSHFVVRTDAGEHRPVESGRDGYYGGEQLPPGESVSRYWVSSVPEDAEAATIAIADAYVDSVAAAFSHDTDLAIDVPE